MSAHARPGHAAPPSWVELAEQDAREPAVSDQEVAAAQLEAVMHLLFTATTEEELAQARASARRVMALRTDDLMNQNRP